MQIEEKPSGKAPFETPFAWIGGEERVKALVERFYDLMDLEPAYTALRAAHGALPDGVGWRVEMHNQIPLARGLGSSAAATVVAGIDVPDGLRY